MADYRFSVPDGKGGMREAAVEEIAAMSGIPADALTKTIMGMNIAKSVSVIVGKMVVPPWVWNKNFPMPIVEWMADILGAELTKRGDYAASQFIVDHGTELYQRMVEAAKHDGTAIPEIVEALLTTKEA